jgi:hypothetical protein
MVETAAFQGERGAFSEEAARALLGRRCVALPALEDVFRSLSEKVRAAGFPSRIHWRDRFTNYDHLLNNDLPIVAETSENRAQPDRSARCSVPQDPPPRPIGGAQPVPHSRDNPGIERTRSTIQ